MKDYQTQISLRASASAVYTALTTQAGLRSWWTSACDAGTAVGELITIRFGQTFKVMRIERLRPDAEVRWRVIDARLVVPGLSRANEWIDTTILFQLVPESPDATRLVMRHIGLTPQFECYELCSQGWIQFLESLKKSLETGAGHPYTEETNKAQSVTRTNVSHEPICRFS